MASTLTHALANRRRPEDEAELALRYGLERVRYGVLDRDPFGRGDVLEVSYAGPAAGVAAFVEASAIGGLPVGLAFADDEAEHALLADRLDGLVDVVGPDPIF